MRLRSDSSARSRRWVWRSSQVPTANDQAMARALGAHPVVARVLIARGMETPEEARAFLNPRLSDLLDPFLLAGMEMAAHRVVQAVREHERICVYGTTMWTV